jgi:hypothetical protein
MHLAVGRLHLFVEHIIEAFGREVTLLVGHPFLQSEVGLYDEFLHGLAV